MADKPEDTGLNTLSSAERDRIDLNREITGVNTSRQSRFFPGDAADLYGSSEKAKSERAYRSLLEMLLAEDPQYAALYNRVAEKLDRAQRAADKALLDINQRLDESEQALQRMRENAAELEDGMKVFRSTEDGHVYTENGRRLTDEEAQEITIPDGAPSWEDYRAQKQAQDEALRQREEVERYQREVLDPIKKRMRDPDNVYSKDELEDLDTTFIEKMPSTVRAAHEAQVPIDAEPSVSISADREISPELLNEVDISSMPEMGKAFDLAHADIPEPEPAQDASPIPPPARQLTRTLG